jgi:hypothetical protein
MPITRKNVKVTCPYLSYNSITKQMEQTTTIQFNYDELVVNKPASTSRPKPADLFRYSTARYTEVTEVSPSFVTQYPTGQSAARIFGVPFTQYLTIENLSTPGPDMPTRESMYNSIRKKLRHDATNLALNLAEYRKTAALFGDLARAVSTRGKSLARGWAGSKTKAVSGNYLKYQYGLKPLCSDMSSAYEELKRAAGTPVYMKGLEQRQAVRRSQIDLAYGGTSWSKGSTVETSVDVIWRTRWRAEMNMNHILSVLAAHGFTNPFSLGYELVPYSFVIDWWINLGDVLASLDNLLLVSKLEVQDSEQRVIYQNAYGSRIGTPETTSGQITRKNTIRRRFGTQEISRVATLAYKPSVSLTHIANGLALLHQAKRN